MEENKKRLKKIICASIFALTVVFTLFALFFDVYVKKYVGHITQHFDEKSMNGFSMLWANPQEVQELDKLGSVSGIEVWRLLFLIMIFVPIIEATVYGIMFAAKTKKIVIIERIFILLNVFLTFAYMSVGVNAILLNDMHRIYEMSTAAHNPFMIVAFLAVAYFVVTLVMKEKSIKKEKVEKAEETTPPNELEDDEELLNSEEIMQEGYDVNQEEL